MGRDKTALLLEGRTLLSRAQELARSLTERVFVVGPRARFGAEAVEDIYSDRGPLGGIHAALTASQTELNLVLSVDTPFLAPEFLRFLVEEAKRCGSTVTVPVAGGRKQTLCAIYRRAFAGFAEEALRAGRNKIDPLFADTTVREISEREIVELDFDPRMFDNLNTPEDLVRAQSRR